MKLKNELLPLLDDLIKSLRKYPKNQVFQKIILEATWLKQELDRGSLVVPLKSPNDVSMAYHFSEGDFDDVPLIKELVEKVLQCLGQ